MPVRLNNTPAPVAPSVPARSTAVSSFDSSVARIEAGTDASINSKLGEIETKNGALGQLVGQFVAAKIADTQSRFRLQPYEAKQNVANGVLAQIHGAAVNGNVTAATWRSLNFTANDPSASVDVQRLGKRILEQLQPAFAPVLTPVQMGMAGRLQMPFTMMMNGRAVQAELVGDKHGDYLSSARVRADGHEYKLNDTALTELLARAGLGWDAENSCQTEVQGQSLLSFFKREKYVHFDGKNFGIEGSKDVSGGNQYFHSGEIALSR